MVWANDGRAALELARSICGRLNVRCDTFAGGAEIAVPLSERASYVWHRIWQPFAGWLIAYFVLWALFRAVRYVATRFMETNESAEGPGGS
jgi:hypothetical protein